ncbi:hypothetical protein [Geomonas oryzae]|uniref:hypothetical protein n=1 Tax=Geomonas oryzae TaxID=2364273 RepID=UPI00100B74A2|nr:hypothetical protein [Geomonas oryzae]
MNDETRKFLEDERFESLFESLYATHKPVGTDIPAQTFQAIGKIIVTFQRLEMIIRDFIAILANMADDQNLVNILTVKSSFSNLLATLSALATEKGFHRVDDLNCVLKKADKAEDIRNQITHSVWSSGPRFKTCIGRKGLVHQSEMYEEGELERISIQIRKIGTSMEALYFDYIMKQHKEGKTPSGVRFIGPNT